MVRFCACLLFALFLHSTQAQSRLAYHEFEAENISRIQLYGSFCDVRISHDQKIRFLGEIVGYGRSEDFEIYSDLTSSGTLVIRVKHRGRRSNQISKAQIQLHIPRGITLHIENSSGDIKGDNLISGKYFFKTTSGDIGLKEIIGNLTVETTSGDISIENLQGTGNVTTTSGDKKVSNVQGKIQASGTSGSSYIYNVMGNVHLSSTSGNLTLRMIKGSVDVSATSGGIYAQKLFITGHSRFELSSGNLKIDLNNPYDDLKFQLVTGSGRINVNGNSFGNKYLEGDGPVVVEGTTGSGNLDLHF